MIFFWLLTEPSKIYSPWLFFKPWFEWNFYNFWLLVLDRFTSLPLFILVESSITLLLSTKGRFERFSRRSFIFFEKLSANYLILFISLTDELLIRDSKEWYLSIKPSWFWINVPVAIFSVSKILLMQESIAKHPARTECKKEFSSRLVNR